QALQVLTDMRLAMLLALLCLALGARGEALDRTSVEARLDRALENRLADSEQEVMYRRAQAQQADSGARLFGSLGAAEVRDVVTQDLVRSYPAVSAQIGVRLPLYGSAASEARGRASAESALAQSRWRRAMVRADTLRAMRLAYVQALRREQQVELANAFLSREAESVRILSRRREQHLLLEADYREYLSMFGLARRNRALMEMERDAARRRLAAMTGLATDGAMRPPAFRTHCLDVARLLAGRMEHAPLQLALASQQERQALLQTSDTPISEAGLVLSQSVIQELGGLTGGASYIGLDVRLPLDWRRAADARRAAALAEVDQAALATRQSEMQFEEAAHQAADALRARREGLDFAARRLDAARASVEAARLRLRLADGDVIENLLQAREAMYGTASDYLEAWLELERAQVDALALSNECPPSEGADHAAAISPEDVMQAMPGLLAEPLSRVASAGRRTFEPGAQTRAKPANTAAPPSGKPGWYAWEGGKWIARADDAPWMEKLARRASRIMLSFDAREIAALAGPSRMAERLDRFLAAAHRKGIAVDLLLGDPGWLDPAGRAALLADLRRLSRFRFDGLNLDLERSQLPPADREHYPQWLIDTISEVAATDTWPVAVSVHYRDMSEPALIARLHQAGLSELCLMVYVSNPQRLTQIVSPILQGHPEVRISVAQSVERELPASESHAGRGARGALTVLEALARELARFPNFAGLRVQSLEAFFELKP
ncbi:MAG: TolC family protein, partial [Zoogloea sp.]|nr:TolC family protein [Zoogloea sp.]